MFREAVVGSATGPTVSACTSLAAGPVFVTIDWHELDWGLHYMRPLTELRPCSYRQPTRQSKAGAAKPIGARMSRTCPTDSACSTHASLLSHSFRHLAFSRLSLACATFVETF